VKICNELVKKVKKYGFSDRTQGGQIQFLQGASPFRKRVQKEPKAKRKFWGQQMNSSKQFWTRGTSKPWASAGASKQGRILEGRLRRSLPIKPIRSLPL